jgi:sialic acid synthase SpsE
MRNRDIARRGLYASADVEPGVVLTAELVVCRRPVAGLPASEFDRVVGRRAKRAIAAGHAIRADDLE